MKHLLVHRLMSPLSLAYQTLLMQVAGQLVTLKLDENTPWIPSLLTSCPKFSNLKLLFIVDKMFDLQYLDKFPEVEILFNLERNLNLRMADAIKLSKLKTLVVRSFNPWSLQMIKLNSGKNIS